MSTQSTSPESLSFWERQFAPPFTSKQVCFDIAFGIVLPLICLYLDPIVFRGSLFGKALFDGNEVLAKGIVFLGMFSLIVWLWVGRPSAWLAGMLASGALFSLLLGIVLLPFSLLGLLMIIGILGFTPLFTAFVFWRNAVRAFRKEPNRNRALLLAIFSFTFVFAAPFAVKFYVSYETTRAFEMIQSDDQETASVGFEKLKRVSVIVNLDRMVRLFESEKDSDRRDRLAKAYQELTGADIEYRLSILND